MKLLKKIARKLNEQEKEHLSTLADFYRAKTGYQYCLIAKKENEPNKNNLVRVQLNKIRQEVAKEKKGSFDIAEFEGK